jgi:ABC-2 type transport system ATP-binding protein
MLAIDKLNKRYANGKQALADVSLQIPAGMFGLLGPNGAGKSTLMRTLATLQDADSGSATLGALDLLKNKDGTRAVLGYLPQEFGLYPRVNAVDLLDHFARLKGLAKATERRVAVEALLQKTNLWDVRHRALGTYSGGMKQRFGIAQALLGSPKLIIVDEPTAGLDPEERLRFHNLLCEISGEVVVILSTHIVSDVADLCASMAVLNDGRVLASGKPADLVRKLDGKVFQRVAKKDEIAELGAMVLSTRLSAGNTVVRVFADAPPSGFEPAVPDLEDAYFHALRLSRVA